MVSTMHEYHNRMDFLIKESGGKCTTCGSVDELEFHHIDPNTKSFNVSVGWSRSLHVVLSEIAKCKLLCRKCHIGVSLLLGHMPGAPARHGTINMYGHQKCRCQECRNEWNRYCRELRNKKKLKIDKPDNALPA